jgi:DNA-binding NtrC family response regulator
MVLALDLCMSRHGRILLVDDDVNARTELAKLLREEGFEVETAADAFQAVGTYDDFAPHIVVADLEMPGMDGIDLVKKLRAQDDPAAVIVVTASDAVSTAVEAMRAGAADYLTRPIHFEELLVVLDTVLETEQLRREIRQLRARVRDLEPMVGHQPDNVGELQSAIERAVVLAGRPHIEPGELPAAARRVPVVPGMPAIPGATMAAIERYAILETLKATGGSTSRTAEMLGLSTRTIQYRLHDYAPRSHVDVVRRRVADLKP